MGFEEWRRVQVDEEDDGWRQMEIGNGLRKDEEEWENEMEKNEKERRKRRMKMEEDEEELKNEDGKNMKNRKMICPTRSPLQAPTLSPPDMHS